MKSDIYSLTCIKDEDITIEVLKEVLDDIAVKIKRSNRFNLTDINVVSENIFGQLLNLIYGYELKAMSAYVSGNFAAVDLIDETNKVAYQVTTDFSRGKITDTLSKFETYGLATKIDRIFVLVLGNINHEYKPPYVVNLSNQQSFDYNKDVINFNGLFEIIRKTATANPEMLIKAYDILTMFYDSGRFEYHDVVEDTEEKTVDKTMESHDCYSLDFGVGDIRIRCFIPITYKGTLSCLIEFRKHDIRGGEYTLRQEELIRDYLVDEDTFCEKHITVGPNTNHMVCMKMENFLFEINGHSAYHVYKCFEKIRESYDEAMKKIYSDLGCTKLKLENGRFFVQEISCDQFRKIFDFSQSHDWGLNNDDNKWNIFHGGCDYQQITLYPNISEKGPTYILAIFKFEPVISDFNDISAYKVYWVPASFPETKRNKFYDITRWTADYSLRWFQELLVKIDCAQEKKDNTNTQTSILGKMTSFISHKLFHTQ